MEASLFEVEESGDGKVPSNRKPQRKQSAGNNGLGNEVPSKKILRRPNRLVWKTGNQLAHCCHCS